MLKGHFDLKLDGPLEIDLSLGVRLKVDQEKLVKPTHQQTLEEIDMSSIESKEDLPQAQFTDNAMNIETIDMDPPPLDTYISNQLGKGSHKSMMVKPHFDDKRDSYMERKRPVQRGQ